MLKLGRNSVQHIFFKACFNWVFRYTTSAISAGSSDFTVDYLMNSLGFSKEEAIITSSKVSSLKSPEKPDSVVNLFKTSGFNQNQIKRIVAYVPQILSFDADKTLKPKLEAFQDFGLYGSELADVVSAHPHVVTRAVDRHIAPTLEVLKSVCEDDLSLLNILKKSTWLLSPCTRKNLPLNIALLEGYGLSVDQIRMLFRRQPSYFVQNTKWLRAVLIRVEEKLGIPRESAMFFHGLCAVGSMKEESLESKFKVFRSFGWSESDILKLARKNPFTLALSESKLRRSLNFFMTDLGHKPAEIASIACVLSFSLERRVIPRNAVLKVLKEKRLIRPDYRIFSCLLLKDQQFFDKFVLPFKDQVLDLYSDHVKMASTTLKTAD